MTFSGPVPISARLFKIRCLVHIFYSEAMNSVAVIVYEFSDCCIIYTKELTWLVKSSLRNNKLIKRVRFMSSVLL